DNFVNPLEGHKIFYNQFNNSQLPVSIQLSIFLNGIKHYGNAATMEDLADLAGVSIGTVYNCIKQVVITILKHHNDIIHFYSLDQEDLKE
ncbi:hypothetical protein BDR06DRAFT_875497, partial [Suillus hirtellus]